MIYVFYLLAAVSVITALMVVFSKSPMSSVIHLIICFLSIAGHYILLNAQFLAVVHIIVYTGAIMVLFVFVLMLLNLNKTNELHKQFLTRISALITGGLMFFVLLGALKGAEAITPKNHFDAGIGLIKNLGMVLYRDFLLPFEVSSVLFLAAMIGAVVLAKNDKNE
jgi:NADH-quinone oxidoreductase subunit J